MNDLSTLEGMAYAPRRTRADRPRSEIVVDPSAPPEPKPLSANAARIAMQIEEIQQDRDAAVRQLSDANARIEQFQSRVTGLQSDLETARLEVGAAANRATAWQAEVIRLKAILENCGGLIADGLHGADPK